MRRGIGSYHEDQEHYGIDVTVKRYSKGAVLVNEGTRNVWIPKSLIKNLEELPPPGRVGNLQLPRWFLEKEALV